MGSFNNLGILQDQTTQINYMLYGQLYTFLVLKVPSDRGFLAILLAVMILQTHISSFKCLVPRPNTARPNMYGISCLLFCCFLYFHYNLWAMGQVTGSVRSFQRVCATWMSTRDVLCVFGNFFSEYFYLCRLYFCF